MGQDDHKPRSENSSCGSGSNKSSKKLKQKKVPQRGLGVAQLEKIRLEEQQKKDIVVPQNNNSNNNNNNNPISAPSVFKTNPGSDFTNKALNFEQSSWGKLWNGEHIFQGGESHRFDQSCGFAFRPSNADLTYESIPVLPSPNGIPRKEFFQPQDSSSSMVRVSSGTSTSSVITYNQMEPPSNQSFFSKIYKWPEDEKIIGIKRSYPFSLDNSSEPTYPCKVPPLHAPYPFFRSTESPSCVNRSLVHVEPRKPLFSGESASLSAMLEIKEEKATEKNGDLNGDFLTLALPKPSLPKPTRELTDERVILQDLEGTSFYSFFPSSRALNGQATNPVTSCSGEVAEKLDLSLKL